MTADSVGTKENVRSSLTEKESKEVSSAQAFVKQIVTQQKSKIKRFAPRMKTDDSEDELVFRHKSASLKLIVLSVILAGLGFCF